MSIGKMFGFGKAKTPPAKAADASKAGKEPLVAAKPAEADKGPRAPDPSETTIWGTKGIAFWTLFGAILHNAGPQSLLEFGSGRSTTFLADYAYRRRKPCVSIEHSDVWHRKAVADLRFMDVKGDYVHLAPLVRPAGEQPWYDFDKTRAAIGGRAFDLLFIDGPVGDSRKNLAGQAIVAEAAREARLILVDDVQRDYNDAFFRDLASRFPADGIFYYRYGGNWLAIAVDEWRPIVAAAFEFLGLEYRREIPAKEPANAGS